MIRINIYEAKVHLSRYLNQLRKGETILLCKRNVPIAEVRPVPPLRAKKRIFGLAKGEFKIPEAFFDPLPQNFVQAFEEKSS